MLRLFVAIDLPDLLRQEIAAMCTQVTNARWVKLHQLHITLRFLGQTPDEALDEVRDKLASVQMPAFALSLRGAGVFPRGPKRARVLWLGLDPAAQLPAAQLPAAQLIDLKDRIDRGLGMDPRDEAQSFSPHLTLARFPEKPDQSLTQFVSTHQSYRSAPWTVACFYLYKSTLSSSGAVHEVIATYPLAQSHQGP